MQSAVSKKLPENVEIMVIDSSGNLLEGVGLEELPDYISDKHALIWCEICATEGKEDGPYGCLLRETFGFDWVTIKDCFSPSRLPLMDNYESYLFMVLFALRSSSEDEHVQMEEVDLYLG